MVENEDVKLTVEVTGMPEPEVEWYLGSRKLSPDATTTMVKLDKKHSLELRKVQIQDSGSIYIKAFNDAGEEKIEIGFIVSGILGKLPQINL